MSADEYRYIFSRQMAAIVYIYYDGSANENSRFALYNDPVFNKSHYTMIFKNGERMRDCLGLFVFIVVWFSIFWGRF